MHDAFNNKGGGGVANPRLNWVGGRSNSTHLCWLADGQNPMICRVRVSPQPHEFIGYDISQAIAATAWVRAIRHNHMDSMIVSYSNVHRTLKNN